MKRLSRLDQASPTVKIGERPMEQDELIEQFVRSVSETSATVERIQPSPEVLNAALLREAGNEQVFLAVSDDVEREFFSLFIKNGNVVTEPTPDQMRVIKVGVTDAFCGIASTGSLCVSINRSLSGPASSLTRKHIVVVDGKAILARPRDVFSMENVGGKGLQRSFSFITGPSATADMGPLVHGVHGPGKLHVIVLD